MTMSTRGAQAGAKGSRQSSKAPRSQLPRFAASSAAHLRRPGGPGSCAPVRACAACTEKIGSAQGSSTPWLLDHSYMKLSLISASASLGCWFCGRGGLDLGADGFGENSHERGRRRPRSRSTTVLLSALALRGAWRARPSALGGCGRPARSVRPAAQRRQQPLQPHRAPASSPHMSTHVHVIPADAEALHPRGVPCSEPATQPKE